MFETFQTVFGGRAFSFRDAIDLAIVGFLVYRLFRFVRGTQATHIVLGALGVVALFATASLLDLRLLGLLLSNVVPYVAFAAIVVFHPGPRRAPSDGGAKERLRCAGGSPVESGCAGGDRCLATGPCHAGRN